MSPIRRPIKLAPTGDSTETRPALAFSFDGPFQANMIQFRERALIVCSELHRALQSRRRHSRGCERTAALSEGPGDRRLREKAKEDRRAQECAAGWMSLHRSQLDDARRHQPLVPPWQGTVNCVVDFMALRLMRSC